jgi:hypothetical protein
MISLGITKAKDTTRMLLKVWMKENLLHLLIERESSSLRVLFKAVVP